MKQTNFLAALALTLFITSCKKEKTVTAPVSNEVRLSAIKKNNATVNTFTYTKEGELAVYTSGNAKTEYSYTAGACNYKWYLNGELKSEIKNTVMNNGKISSCLYQSYSGGVPGWSSPYNFLYNAEGRVTSWSDNSSSFNLEYAGGNFTKVLRKDGGVHTQTNTYEYYTDKPNKLNIPFWEYLLEMPVLFRNQAGIPNSHLMKKATHTYAGNTKTWEFSYIINAAGYVTQYTEVYTKNNEPAVTNVYELVY